MSSRRPRSRFAAPLVVTLALAPGCVLRSGPSAPPPGGRTQTGDHRGDDTTTIVNPPRPVGGSSASAPPSTPPGRPPHAESPGADRVVDHGSTAPPPRQPDGSTDVVQAGPAPQPPAPTVWTVFQRPDKGCYAMMDVQCPPPPATCNPPPPRELSSCPTGVSEKKSVKVRELSPGECFVTPAMGACPPAATCNPPRPIKTECPG